MVDAKELGKLGEKLAAEELSKKGYKLLTKNFFYDHKEVDIICEHEGQKLLLWKIVITLTIPTVIILLFNLINS